ncbi:hypothetical protein Clacol_006955 [Clathrus columnatus]|uniref:Uncharacterized protein n=1 Tax=Clathrus columnatus TaxID=1419009 RepID=A0AAV5AJR8_9AGAM|nr:hypothetical protein Clacol_006955 [Clathrus columnatus]
MFTRSSISDPELWWAQVNITCDDPTEADGPIQAFEGNVVRSCEYTALLLHLGLYFCKPGHPDDPFIHSMVDEGKWHMDAESITLRCKLFQKFTTGSELLPVRAGWCLTIKVIKDLDSVPAWSHYPKAVSPTSIS